MVTKNTKKSKLYKGAVLGAAGLMCLSFTPVAAINAFADYLGDDAANTIGSEVITVDGANGSVTRGEKYEVKNAYFGTKTKVKLGLSDAEYATALAASGDYENLGFEGNAVSKITSEIKVTYATGADVEITANATADDYYGTFVAEEVGEYTISYAITVDYENAGSKTYSTEVLVQSETGSAAIAFEDKTINMPSTYDKKLATKADGTLKDIQLSIPSVYENDEEEAVELTDVLVGEKPAAGTKGKVVAITVSKTSKGQIVLDKVDGKVYIRGAQINTNVANNDNIVVTYAYYVDGEFVTSESKTIRVYDNHYADAKGNSTYKLTASLSSNVVNAVTKVAVKLPTISAYPSEDSNDKLDVTTEISALRKVNGKFINDAPEGFVAIEDGKFTPWADGDYKIVYKVTDFYGNSVEKQILIEGVKDTKKPEAIMYDAGDSANVKAESKFVSAETKLKTKTNQNNVIIYAVGGTDNVSEAKDMTYSRTIKASSRTIEINNIYNDYNLIFDATEKLYDKTNTENALLNDNYYLYTQIKADFDKDGTKSLENDADIKEWLLSHNYLFVTNAPVDGHTDEAYCASKGYAYLNVNYSTMLAGSSNGTGYNVSYIATDKAGVISETNSFTMTIYDGSFVVDADATPKITMNSTFTRYYSLKDVISFNAPTISDTNDDYVESKISYKLYKESTEIYAHVFKEDEDYKINMKKVVDELVEEWIAADPTNNTKDNFTNYPTKVEIIVYAVNNFGRVAEKVVEADIIDVVDTVSPTLIRENYNTNHTSITQNSLVELPTIVYTDDYVNFMSSEVRVYHIAGDERIPVESKNLKANPSSKAKTYTLNAGSFMAAFAGEYEVVVRTKDYASNYIVSYYYYSVDAKMEINKPYINSSLSKETTLEAGEALTLPVPQVDYTIDDDYDIYGVSEADKSATNYKVVLKGGNPSDYELLDNETFIAYNYKKDTYSLAYEVGLQVFKKGYNLNKTKEGVTLVKGPDTYYMSRFAGELGDNGEHTGDYILVTYNAGKIEKVIYGEVNGTAINFYNISTNLNNAGYITDANGVKYEAVLENGLVFRANGGLVENYISAEVDGGELIFTAHGNVTLTTTSVTSLATEAITNGTDALTTKEFTEITQTSETYNITVADSIAPKLMDGVSYEYATTAEKGATIYLAPIKAKDPSGYMASGIDKENSYVKVAFSGRTSSTNPNIASTSTSYSTEYKMSEWASKANAQDMIEYTLSSTNNGTYTITYHIVDKAGNVIASELGKTKFEIKVGDTQAPDLTFGKNIIKDVYNVNDVLTLDMSQITMTDGITTDSNVLLKTMKVTVKNETTNSKKDNIEDGVVLNSETGKYEGLFSYKLDDVGTYSVEIEITDEAGWVTTQTLKFEVATSEKDANTVSTVVGIVLVVVAVAVLAGVVIYFVVSKVKLDKELGGKKKNDKK